MEKEKLGCKKCGECCKWVMIMMGQHPDVDFLEYVKLHEDMSVQSAEGQTVLWIRSKCAMLNKDGTCKIHEDPKRPEGCRKYPAQMPNWAIPAGCGYRRRA